MATKEPQKERMNFKNVELFKTETLGTGSYGAVCKAKCDELICAAKLLYPVLFQMQPQAPEPGREHRHPFRRFELECRFLSRINHPNIVQCLGTYRDPETNAPVLLMELMDESLAHFLNSSPGPILYHVQVNLSYDVAQALAFLHANGITHRDLSSNNVLLSDKRAKVADFGMSKFADINATRLATLTKCPGTAAFMSPEALNEPPVYTEKLDVFSLGVIMVQIMTQMFPQPSDRLRSKEVIDPSSSNRKIHAQVPVPEAERRHAHISLIDPTHPLLPIAQTCLRDEDSGRPSSSELCGIFSVLKVTGKYKASSSAEKDQFRLQQQQLKEKDEEIKASKDEIKKLKRNLETKEWELREKSEELEDRLDLLKANEEQVLLLKNDLTAQGDLRQTNNRKLQENETLIAHLRQNLADTTEQIETMQAQSEKFERRKRVVSESTSHIQEARAKAKQAIKRRSCQVASPELSLEKSTTNGRELEWTSVSDCPIFLYVGSATVVDNKAYFQSKDNQTIVEYDCTSRQWSLTPYHPLQLCSLVSINHQLTTVGGFIRREVSDKLCTLRGTIWDERFPRMPTKRESPAVVFTNEKLIVVGGRNRYQNPLKVVEILDTLSGQWSEGCSLLFPAYQLSAVQHRGNIYLSPGEGGYNHPKYSVTTCPLELLLDTNAESPIATSITVSLRSQSKWRKVSDLPVQSATLVVVNGHLLAVGGEDPPKMGDTRARGTKVIYEYNHTDNRWRCFGQTKVARSHGLAAVLPGNRLMVVGGILTSNKGQKSSEYISIID